MELLVGRHQEIVVVLRIRHDIAVRQHRQRHLAGVAEYQVKHAHSGSQHTQSVVIDHPRTGAIQREIRTRHVGNTGRDIQWNKPGQLVARPDTGGGLADQRREHARQLHRVHHGAGLTADLCLGGALLDGLQPLHRVGYVSVQGGEHRAHLVVVGGHIAPGAHVQRDGGRQRTFSRRLAPALQVALEGTADHSQGDIVEGNAGGVLDRLETSQREFRRVEYAVRPHRPVEYGLGCRHVGRRNLFAGDIQRILANGHGIAGGAGEQLHGVLHPVDRGPGQQFRHARVGIDQARFIVGLVVSARIRLQVVQGRHER